MKSSLFSALTLMIVLMSTACAAPKKLAYPAHWWTPVDKKSAKWWEILPQDAKKGEVILSKRNELGILSNFAHTPFEFEGVKYQSVEGLWQSMKFPENDKDPRFKGAKHPWKHSREAVAKMVGFEAKRAGGIGSKNMKAKDINWVTYKGKRMTYRTTEKGDHYKLIRRIMEAKVRQNPKVKEILLATGDLKLMPDHQTKPNSPPAWKYHVIWMEIRDQLKNEVGK